MDVLKIILLSLVLNAVAGCSEITSGDTWDARTLSARFPGLWAGGLSDGSDVPAALLEELSEKADFHKQEATQFTCVESIDKGKHATSHDYLLAFEDNGRLQEIRMGRKRRVKSARHTFPPPFAWTLILSSATTADFTLRYLGRSFEGFELVHRIAFRGNRLYETGDDPREWEGLVIINATTLEFLRIEAVPRIPVELLEAQRRAHLRSLRFGFGVSLGPQVLPIKTFRRRRAPSVTTLIISFEARRGVSVPAIVQLGEHRLSKSREFVLTGTEERRYTDYRFFTTETSTLGYEDAED